MKNSIHKYISFLVWLDYYFDGINTSYLLAWFSRLIHRHGEHCRLDTCPEDIQSKDGCVTFHRKLTTREKVNRQM